MLLIDSGKNKKDEKILTRKEARKQAFFILFEQAVQPKPAQEAFDDAAEARDFALKPFIKALVTGVESNNEKIDQEIKGNLKGWSLSRISKISLAILRLSVYEILFEPTIPVGVTINEAVELAKEYGSKDDAPYINGVLSAIEKTAQYKKTAT